MSTFDKYDIEALPESLVAICYKYYAVSVADALQLIEEKSPFRNHITWIADWEKATPKQLSIIASDFPNLRTLEGKYTVDNITELVNLVDVPLDNVVINVQILEQKDYINVSTFITHHFKYRRAQEQPLPNRLEIRSE